MKRLITILVIFSLMLSIAIFEMAYTSKFYSKEYDLLKAVEQKFDADPKNLNNAEVIKAVDDAFDHFDKCKNYLMALSHHNAIKAIEEKLLSLKELVRMNQEFDAYVTLKVVQGYVAEIKNENTPTLPNLF